MTKELIEEIMELEHIAEERLEAAFAEKELIIKKAHEKAHKLIAQAESTFDSQREEQIHKQDELLHAEKDRIISKAKEEAAQLAAEVEQRLPAAADSLFKKITEKNSVS